MSTTRAKIEALIKKANSALPTVYKKIYDAKTDQEVEKIIENDIMEGILQWLNEAEQLLKYLGPIDINALKPEVEKLRQEYDTTLQAKLDAAVQRINDIEDAQTEYVCLARGEASAFGSPKHRKKVLELSRTYSFVFEILTTNGHGKAPAKAVDEKSTAPLNPTETFNWLRAPMPVIKSAAKLTATVPTTNARTKKH